MACAGNMKEASTLTSCIISSICFLQNDLTCCMFFPSQDLFPYAVKCAAWGQYKPRVNWRNICSLFHISLLWREAVMISIQLKKHLMNPSLRLWRLFCVSELCDTFSLVFWPQALWNNSVLQHSEVWHADKGEVYGQNLSARWPLQRSHCTLLSDVYCTYESQCCGDLQPSPLLHCCCSWVVQCCCTTDIFKKKLASVVVVLRRTLPLPWT